MAVECSNRQFDAVRCQPASQPASQPAYDCGPLSIEAMSLFFQLATLRSVQ